MKSVVQGNQTLFLTTTKLVKGYRITPGCQSIMLLPVSEAVETDSRRSGPVQSEKLKADNLYLER